MPHVSVKGPVALEERFSAFELGVERNPAGSWRVKNLYLSRKGIHPPAEPETLKITNLSKRYVSGPPEGGEVPVQ